MWPFNRGPSKRELKNRLVALAGSLEIIQVGAVQTERLLGNAEVKLRKAEIDLEKLWPEVRKLQADHLVANTRALAAEEESSGLRAALKSYGYPTNVAELRGKLALDEEMFLALKRKQEEKADDGVEEEEA